MLDDTGFTQLDEARPGERSLALALQGGGSFGAFTWGVLDRLLEDEAVTFDVVSGASAGALNAVLLASGLLEGGRAGARATLDAFWGSVRQVEPVGLLGFARPAAATALRLSAQVGLPFSMNPSNFNPLRDLLAKAVDFDRLRAARPLRLLIAATRVRDGRLRLFREDEISLDAVLASACLPTFQRAVEIDGEAYWDGGLSANPPLRQLTRDTRARDVLLVQIMPEEHPGVPHLAADVLRRVSEIAFTAPLQRELEALADLRDTCRGQTVWRSQPCEKLEQLRFHRIGAVDLVADLAEANALDTGWEFLTRLHDQGRTAADGWLKSPNG